MDSERSLGEQSWPDVRSGGIVMLPLGSTEQHGPHLPLDTDTRIAQAIAMGAAAELGAVVAPLLAYGASGEHAGFAGTLSIGTEALRVVLIELVRSAAMTFGTMVFVNGHGGNVQAVDAATSQLVDEGHDVRAWYPRVTGGDAHAGRTETSLMLAIAPEVVQMDRAAVGITAPLSELMPRLRAGGVADVSTNGVLGDPTGASAQEGSAILGRLVADLAVMAERA